jgi:hypothetical protein
MAINLPGVPFKLTPQDMGGFDLADALRSGMQTYEQGVKSAYAPKNYAEALLAQQLQNKINSGKAKYAEPQAFADLQGTQSSTSLNKANVNRILQDMNQKKYQMQQDKAFQDLLSGKMLNGFNNAPQQSNIPDNVPNNNAVGNITNRPGIQSINDYSDNGMSAEGPGISQSASAYDTFPGRRAQNKVPLKQNIEQGLKNNPDKQIIAQGNPELQHINNLYDNSPQYRKKLESMGYKKTQTIKYDPKTGTTSVITKMPNGEVSIQTQNDTNPDKTVPLTNQVKDRMQKIIAFAPKVIEDLKDLKNTTSPARFSIWKADERNAYDRKVKKIAESFAVAKGWPNVLGSIEKAEKIINRGDYESTASYNKALDNLIDDLMDSQKTANKTLYPNKTNNSENDNNVMKFNPATGRLE